MTVLHIEDNASISRWVQIALASTCVVHTAESLTEAKRRLASGCRYDLLLIDLNLGDSAGMDTLEALRDYGVTMVVLTADPTEEFVNQAADYGVADYLSKLDMAKTNLAMRLRFVKSREAKRAEASEQECREQKRHSGFNFHGIAAIRPYLSCSVLAQMA